MLNDECKIHSLNRLRFRIVYCLLSTYNKSIARRGGYNQSATDQPTMLSMVPVGARRGFTY